jgi:hypothetical protein
MKTTVLVLFVVIALFATPGHSVAQVYRVRLISESPEGQEVVKAVKESLRTNKRYVVTDESKVDLTLEVECGAQTTSSGYFCASAVIFWGQSVYPLPAPMSGVNLFKGPNAAAVADVISKGFVLYTNDENISLIIRAMQNWISLFCKNPVNKNACQP